MSVTVSLVNRLAEHATVFFRARGLTHVSLNANFSDNLVGDAQHDCSKGKTVGGVPCANDDNTTLFFPLAEHESVDLYFRASDVARSAVVWASPDSATRVSAGGPSRQSQAEFDMAATQIVFDVTFVEAVSCGVVVAYYAAGATQPDKIARAVPTTPLGRYDVQISRLNNVPVVLSNKYAETNASRRLLAECPAELANNACGQHRCRVYYATLMHTGHSYCNWIQDTGCDAYCWAMDELRCTDPSCGYGRADQPRQLDGDGMAAGNCNVPAQVSRGPGQAPLWAANDYSCGAIANLPQPPVGWAPSASSPPTTVSGTATWWTSNSSVGCVPNTNPRTQMLPLQTATRGAAGGTLVVSFENLPWLSGVDRTATAAAAGDAAGRKKYDRNAPLSRDRYATEPAAGWRVGLAIVLILVSVLVVVGVIAAVAVGGHDSAVAIALAASPHAAVAV
jgi:hypothetical protein